MFKDVRPFVVNKLDDEDSDVGIVEELEAVFPLVLAKSESGCADNEDNEDNEDNDMLGWLVTA